jgi:type II secretory pathway component GspD/PulD (secretin)
MRMLVLPVLACSLLVVMPLIAEEPVVRAGAEDPEKVLDNLQGENARNVEAQLAEAEALYIKALSQYKQAHFVDALQSIEEACRVFPAHKKAQDLRQRIKGILGYHSDRWGMLISWLGDLGEVAVQENAIRLANLIKDGDKALAAGEFNQAHNCYDSVLVNIRTFPLPFDWGDLPEQIEKKKLQARSNAREADLNQHQEALQEANEQALQAERRKEWELQVRVNQILARANRAYERGNYKRAALDALYAYKMDRRREAARTLYLAARRASHDAFDEWFMREVPERRARVNERIHAGLIPQDELLSYPEHWDQINQRQLTEIGERAEEQWRVDLSKRLEQEVTFIWEDTSLDDAVQFLRQTTGVNFIIDPKALAAAPPPITLNAANMKLKTALKWIERITKLTANIRGQVVFLSSEMTQGDVVVRPYDVTDLTMGIPDFEGPQLSFGGGGGEGFDVFGGGDAAAAAGGDAAAIAEFIRANVAPTTWTAPGRSIEPRRGGSLFISTSPEIHDQIEALLSNLRKQRSLQVNIRVRLLDLSKVFMEEIGFEWQDLPVSTGMLASNTADGFTKIGSDALIYSRTTQALPGAATQAAFPSGSGIVLESAYNPTGLFNTAMVNGVLEAMELENDSTILLSPELTCYNSQRAVYLFIRQYAYISDYQLEGGGDGANATYDPVIQVLNLGDVIDVRPLVSADRKYITMEMRPTSRLLSGAFIETLRAVTEVQDGVVAAVEFPLELPNIEVRALRTTVTMPDKGSMLMGGYSRGLRQRMHSGIPFLSHIPFLGRLFSSNGIYDENRRLFFLVTATIIDLGEMEAMQ